MPQTKFIKHFLLFNFILISLVAKAQLENRIFSQKDTFYQNDTQSVRLNIEVFNYLRNTEYFDIIEKGQTLFGALFHPTISYQPYKNILIKGGFQTRQDYGSGRFFSVQPTLTLSYFKHKWRHNFGTLQGNLNFGFIEPLYNIDRGITHRIENGIQGIYTGKTLVFNNFLVWDEPTYRTTSNQERFVTGFTLNKTLKKNDNWDISFPFQGLLAHRGGQLNSNPNPIYSRINVATGLKLKYKINSKWSLKTENYYIHSEDFSPTISQPYKNGNANWHTFSVIYKRLELMLNYWEGREFHSPVGSLIYNNFNVYDIYLHRQTRRMLMSRILYTQELNKGTQIDLRFEPFYDFEYEQFQYSYSVYLKLNFNQFLGKLKI